MIDPFSIKNKYIELKDIISLQIKAHPKMCELLRTEEGIEKLYYHFSNAGQDARSLQSFKDNYKGCFKINKSGLYTVDAARVIISKVGIAYYGSVIVLMEQDKSKLPAYLGNPSMAPMANFRLEFNL